MQRKSVCVKQNEWEKKAQHNTISIYSQNVKSCLAKHSSLPVIQKHFPLNWIYVNFFFFLAPSFVKYILCMQSGVWYRHRLSNGVNWFAMHLFTFSFSPFTITLWSALNIFIFRWIFWSNLPANNTFCISLSLSVCVCASIHFSLLSLYTFTLFTEHKLFSILYAICEFIDGHRMGRKCMRTQRIKIEIETHTNKKNQEMKAKVRFKRSLAKRFLFW